jgi:molybdenum cofactor cytidylyltransferase
VIVGLVLAAGASTRMGEERNKLLEELGGRALVVRVVDALVEAGLDRVVVMLGHEADGVRGRVGSRPRVEYIEHPGWRSGMGSTLAAGAAYVARVAPDAAILVCVGDLPGLRADAVEAVVQAYQEAGRTDAVCVPIHAGRVGHPVVFGPDWADRLARLAGDRGARALIDAAGVRVIQVEVPDPGIFQDVDLPSELEAWRSRTSRSA